MMDIWDQSNKTGEAAKVVCSRRRALQVLPAASLTGIFTSPISCWADETSDFSGTKLWTEERIRSGAQDLWKLVDVINHIRGRRGLSKIPLSPKLTAVAALHARDLARHKPDEKRASLHSWSQDPRWKGGTYVRSDQETWPIMWDKPKEITGYRGYGFEICAAKLRDLYHALEVWRESRQHWNVIIHRGPWAEPRWQWKSIGAVYHRGYACAWFGDKANDYGEDLP